jgi:hypothetical protein
LTFTRERNVRATTYTFGFAQFIWGATDQEIAIVQGLHLADLSRWAIRIATARLDTGRKSGIFDGDGSAGFERLLCAIGICCAEGGAFLAERIAQSILTFGVLGAIFAKSFFVRVWWYADREVVVVVLLDLADMAGCATIFRTGTWRNTGRDLGIGDGGLAALCARYLFAVVVVFTDGGTLDALGIAKRGLTIAGEVFRWIAGLTNSFAPNIGLIAIGHNAGIVAFNFTNSATGTVRRGLTGPK